VGGKSRQRRQEHGEPHVFVSADTRKKPSFSKGECSMSNNHSSIISNHLPFARAYKALFWSFFAGFCAFCAFLCLTNPVNQRNPRLKKYFSCRSLSLMSLQANTYVPIRHSTTVENPLQIDPFMQNKPNFRKSQMNVNPYNTRDYENKHNWTLGENEPNTNPNKPNFRKA